MRPARAGHQEIYRHADPAGISTVSRFQHVDHINHARNTAQSDFTKHVNYILIMFLALLKHISGKGYDQRICRTADDLKVTLSFAREPPQDSPEECAYPWVGPIGAVGQIVP